MQYYQNSDLFSRIPLRTKVSAILWILFCLGAFFLFSFTIFMLALIAGIIILVLSFFQKAQESIQPETKSSSIPPLEPPRRKYRDDDIIDV